MTENLKIPEIRYSEFTKPWEQRKLGETVQITMGQSPGGENYTENPKDYILVQGNADMKNGRVVPRVWTTQVTKKADPEDIILSVRAPVGDVGKTDYPVVLGRGVAGIKGNAFIFQTLSRMKEIGFWTRYSSGSTFESINSADLKDAVIQIPNIEEQIKIGEFFTKLDDTIALHQRKYDKTICLKKAMLEKMFPKNGEDKPQIRLGEFTDSWEQRKLGEIIESYSGGTPSVGNRSYYGGSIPFIRSGEINSKNTQLYLTEEGLNSSSAKLVEEGDILYALYGATSGEVGLSQMNGAINQAVLAIRPKSEYDSKFIMQWLRRQKYSIISTYLQGGQGNLSGSIVKELILSVPIQYDEQIKIGAFFKQLDDTIALYQLQLEKLHNIKKAFLEKMFI